MSVWTDYMDNSSPLLTKPRAIASVASDKVHDAIRRRAEEIYIRSGRVAGRDIQNWAQAEAEIMNELAAGSGCLPAIVINVEGVQYVGEYDPNSAGDYKPGEFAVGTAIPIRFDGDKMFVLRPNGCELETTIVSKF
jgi:hypothetical protein